MSHIEFFKLQAKNLFRDYQTKKPSSPDGDYLNDYDPKYFDIQSIMLYFDVDEDNFTLMKAQHIIANIVGFSKWTDMLKASEPELKLAKLLFDNQHKVSAEDWDMYLRIAEDDNKTIFDIQTKLEIFELVFVNQDGHESTFPDYRLNKNKGVTNRRLRQSKAEIPRLKNQLAKGQSMEEVLVKNKKQFLNEHYPFGVVPELTEKFRCLHCGEVITVGEYKVFKEEDDDFLYICCPNAPECDGTVIDWIDVDANH